MPRTPPTSRPHPSSVVDETAGPIVRVPAGGGLWFYAHSWKQLLIFYRWLGHEDLALDHVIKLPVAFRVFGNSTNLANKHWKGAEIIGFCPPSGHAEAPVAWAAPIRGAILRWNAATGLVVQAASLPSMHGLPLAPECHPNDYAKRLHDVLAGAHVEPTFGTVVSAASAEVDAYSPFELFPDSNELCDELMGQDDLQLVAMIDAQLDVPDGVFLDRDVLGPALMAATIVASPTPSSSMQLFDPLPALVDRMRERVSKSLVMKAHAVVLRAGSEESDYAPRSPIFSAFIDDLDRLLLKKLATLGS